MIRLVCLLLSMVTPCVRSTASCQGNVTVFSSQKDCITSSAPTSSYIYQPVGCNDETGLKFSSDCKTIEQYKYNPPTCVGKPMTTFHNGKCHTDGPNLWQRWDLRPGPPNTFCTGGLQLYSDNKCKQPSLGENSTRPITCSAFGLDTGLVASVSSDCKTLNIYLDTNHCTSGKPPVHRLTANCSTSTRLSLAGRYWATKYT
eukprot:TRINITY_DN68049_c4_g2_i1.p1 TRINITY_DN68049_c4_g2~~TRINITY_DN68049_c4_g2_i1.p1  ORF type:complete len:201 (-),score=2.71 TRINITY_DN68049_c4_g2_i1:690-1292(-)